MHSSRMCTDRRLTVSGGGGGGRRGVSRGESGVSRGGGCPEVVCPGVYGCGIPPGGQTDTCENITFPHITYAVGNHRILYDLFTSTNSNPDTNNTTFPSFSSSFLGKLVK